MKGQGSDLVPFAPPILRHEGLLIAQTANILGYAGPRLGLGAADELSRVHAHQLMLTLMDFLSEVHDTHHPITVSQYYEDQKPEALRKTRAFVTERMRKFLGYFERVLEKSSGAHALGSNVSYVDLALFQTHAGLCYAFPRAMKELSPKIPKLVELAARIAEQPKIAAYLESPRRLPFNESGLFRKYAELDLGLHEPG